MILSTHVSGNRLLASVIDSELLGKRFEEGELQLDLSSSFFKGEEKDESEVADICNKALSVYFVGKKSVALGIKLGLVDEDKVKQIESVPHCQMMRI